MKRVVVISGHCQPVHRGHVDYCKYARDFAGPDGVVIFIVNNDKQAVLKKGYSFVPQEDRLAVISAIRHVDKAVLSIDEDRTVCKTLQMLCDTEGDDKPTFFGNGGDVDEGNRCPEEEVCRQNGIRLVYGFGDKVQSSSWILEKSVRVAFHAMSRDDTR
ncbi:FAD synthase [Tetrabaena socialis]|uniref:FAD synthase n=1 Tax=Tetrabaena socialis TaxID=47790 RepID=A0A2J8AJ50_9CHLO|nr:FAD synthase [Tetrabaena socialis]PNH12540.1 FAD synthase [Tetrabaena socialis]|eukprot:PNH00643.1 FAD synthase [Tetrabaena socialis]